jgi:hypothetical protein
LKDVVMISEEPTVIDTSDIDDIKIDINFSEED